MPLPAHFKAKGHKKWGGGRAPGQPNHVTVEVRDVLKAAAEKIGGLDRMVEWIHKSPKNEFAFWSQMYMKLLPVRIIGGGPHGEVELNVKVTHEELDQRLEEHGLPRNVFALDAPVLELEAVKEPHPVKGNGKDSG